MRGRVFWSGSNSVFKRNLCLYLQGYWRQELHSKVNSTLYHMAED